MCSIGYKYELIAVKMNQMNVVKWNYRGAKNVNIQVKCKYLKIDLRLFGYCN